MRSTSTIMAEEFNHYSLVVVKKRLFISGQYLREWLVEDMMGILEVN